jgi:CubicO group peptidase (beta-lactamase class C family)
MLIPRQVSTLLAAFVDQRVRAGNIPGVCVALTDREKLLGQFTHGFADMATRAPLTPYHLFEIGSVSKSFTAIATLQLCEGGQLDLHAPVTRFLPWFHVPSDHEPITLHHLLSHTAGIIRGTEFTAEACYEVWALRDMQAIARPGTYFHYSNVGYKALGLVLEEVLDQSYRAIIQERILDRLGMDSTEPVITHDTRKRLAVGYESLYDDRPAHPSHPLVPATWLETGTADGSIASTAVDMAVYVRMLLNRGQGPRGRVLSEESFRLMTRRVIELPDEDEEHGSSYGYGLNLSEDEGHTIIGHGGGMVGYYASILADLDDGLGVIVLINSPGEPAGIARFTLKLLRAAFHDQQLPPLPPTPVPTCIDSPADFAARYRSKTGAFTLAVQGERLIMVHCGDCLALEERGEDRFHVPHPDFARFHLRFGREEGEVVEAFHGPNWYVNERYRGPTRFDFPEEWAAYPGHYRSHNPWYTNFHVISRKGKLFLVEPSGDEEVLVPLEDSVFRIGDDERIPERLHFDTVLSGRALRANLSGCDYYRTFTP